MTRRKAVLAMVLPFVVLLVSAGLIAYIELRQQPLQKLRQAITSLEEARKAHADRWAAESYHSAQKSLAAGQKVMADVNEDWWPFGSYRPADSLLTESIRLSRLAKSQAETTRRRQANSTAADIAALDDSLSVWGDVIDRSLPRTEEALLYRSACFGMQMAKNMLEKKQYEAAADYADSVHTILGTLDDNHRSHRSSSERWIRQSHDWVMRTVEASAATGEKAIIVDKKRHWLFVLAAGKVVDSMACDLGYNSGQQKRVMGDGATPEGMYHVTKVNRGSKYYLALLLNYPNADDRRRFQSNLASGAIPVGSKMGGLIEIHGHGGTGRDWTDGCVAVEDKHMDRLLHSAAVGTPVTIVRIWEK